MTLTGWRCYWHSSLLHQPRAHWCTPGGDARSMSSNREPSFAVPEFGPLACAGKSGPPLGPQTLCCGTEGATVPDGICGKGVGEEGRSSQTWGAKGDVSSECHAHRSPPSPVTASSGACCFIFPSWEQNKSHHASRCLWTDPAGGRGMWMMGHIRAGGGCAPPLGPVPPGWVD